MSGLPPEVKGLLLDASTLLREGEVKRLLRQAHAAGVPVYVAASVYAEMQRRFKAKFGGKFDPELVENYLRDNYITIVDFTRDDADELVALTDQALGGDSHAAREQAWQLWKMRKAAHHLRPAVHRALDHLKVVYEQQALAPALDQGAHAAVQDNKRFPGTVDWLMLGIARRRSLAIITEEDPGHDLSEFRAYPLCYRLARALTLMTGTP